MDGESRGIGMNIHMPGMVFRGFLAAQRRWTAGEADPGSHKEDLVCLQRLSMRKIKEVLRLRFGLGCIKIRSPAVARSVNRRFIDIWKRRRLRV